MSNSTIDWMAEVMDWIWRGGAWVWHKIRVLGLIIGIIAGEIIRDSAENGGGGKFSLSGFLFLGPVTLIVLGLGTGNWAWVWTGGFLAWPAIIVSLFEN